MSEPEFWELRMLIEQWDLIADQMRSGYKFPFEDYLNDLDMRRMIDDRMRAIEADGGVMPPSSLLTMLESADARFRDSTSESSQNVWGDQVEREEGWTAERQWYYYRIPNVHSKW